MINPTEQLLDQMESLSNVPIVLRAELDQTRLTFGEMMNLEVGSVIRLSRPTGENIDVYAENVLVGWGEVLMVDGALTVRLADVRDVRPPSLDDREDQSAPSSVAGEK